MSPGCSTIFSLPIYSLYTPTYDLEDGATDSSFHGHKSSSPASRPPLLKAHGVQSFLLKRGAHFAPFARTSEMPVLRLSTAAPKHEEITDRGRPDHGAAQLRTRRLDSAAQ